MTEANVIFNGSRNNDTEPGDIHTGSPNSIAHVLFRLSQLDLPAKEHFESYLRYKVRANVGGQ